MRVDRELFTTEAAVSKITVPLFRVCKKLSSSAVLTARILAASLLSSGY
jgi:hypothetical protein